MDEKIEFVAKTQFFSMKKSIKYKEQFFRYGTNTGVRA